MWNHRDKWWILSKEKVYGVVILTFHSQVFGFGYPLIVSDLQNVNEYCNLYPKYVATDAENTILGHN